MKSRISTSVVITALVFSMQAIAKGPPDRPVILTDANGVKIGRVIGMGRISLPTVLTDKGYRTELNLGISENPAVVFTVRQDIYYENTNCPKDGVAYINSPGNAGTVFSPSNDREYAYDAGRLMYSPPDPQIVKGVPIRSVLFDGVCDNVEQFSMDGYPAYLNDPDVTGIENTRYPARLIME